MLASIPANEMAETLRVLAGDNAANAARHFSRRSHDMGDASSAVLWSSIAQVLNAMSAAAPDAAAGLAPESAAMRGVRKAGARTITSAIRGTMHNAATRNEAMSLIMHGTR